ncbi:hypothetical protein FTUN_7657 [Frigoriglobus tundricola]|uniref:Uncharacterized protein n=1 Tax=Frigoriglobus tundricola TaxID=2774151 RepID=A0A6M5Z2T8_9BACT|nr:hypothetical protein FTUN_7657 [Frigoriglobus tundricola]
MADAGGNTSRVLFHFWHRATTADCSGTKKDDGVKISFVLSSKS